MPLVESFLLSKLKQNQKKKKRKEETNEFHISFPTTALETSDIVNNPVEEQIRPLYESPARSMRMPFA